MSRDLFIPLKEMPHDLNEAKKIITDALLAFGLKEPVFKFQKDKPDSNLLNDFLLIKGEKKGDQCWLSFNEDIYGINEAGYGYWVSIGSRGNPCFVAIIALAFCKYAGHVIKNDNGMIDGPLSYTAEEMQMALINSLDPLARIGWGERSEPQH